MPAWEEYKAAAVERGSLALELYMVVSTPEKAPKELQAILPDHLAYQAEQEQLGSLVMAGPLSDLSGDLMEGVGLIIYRAASLAAARAIAEADPMHKSGTRSFVIRRWLVNEGSFQLDIKLSVQSVKL
jgi:uncharacterized protein YciI